MDDISELLQDFEELTDKIESALSTRKREIAKRRAELEELEMFGNYDQELVKAFFDRPYAILPRREEEWYLIVPKFFDMNVGYLTKSTDSYNIFIVNKYADYLGAVPSEFQQIFKFKPKIPLKVYDGMMLTGQEYQDTAWERYSKFLSRREGSDKIRVKKAKQFQLIAQLIHDGILPFIPHPVEKAHLVTGQWKQEIEEIDRRRQMDFFKIALNRFLETGAVGVYWAMGVGKTIFGLELLSRIKVEERPNLVISGSSVALREQWLKQLELIAPAAPVEVYTYHSWHKVKNRDWGLVIFDECHHLPAETFSRLSTLNAEYRAGLSATPYREDGRTDYIFALTGFPVGLDWRVLIDLDLIKEPEITLFLCSNYREKQQKLAELLQFPEKTLIYCFSLDLGKSLSTAFDIPFVYGDTPAKDRLEIINNSQTTIISSAGREGLSLQDIERTITYNFLFGSRQEETQFFGRLLHGESEGRHIILMTEEEYERYGKRLYGIQEKGFKIRISRVGGGYVSTPTPRPRQSTPRMINKPIANPEPALPTVELIDKTDLPLFDFLDDRDPFDKEMVFKILLTDYARDRRGLNAGEVRAILDHYNIKYGAKRKVEDLLYRLYRNRDLSGRKEGTKRRYFKEAGNQ